MLLSLAHCPGRHTTPASRQCDLQDRAWSTGLPVKLSQVAYFASQRIPDTSSSTKTKSSCIVMLRSMTTTRSGRSLRQVAGRPRPSFSDSGCRRSGLDLVQDNRSVFLQEQVHSRQCGPASRSTSLRPRPLNRTRRLRYRGPWRLPGPDSHRLAVESLRSAYVMTAPLRSGDQPSCWTHVNQGLGRCPVGDDVVDAIAVGV